MIRKGLSVEEIMFDVRPEACKDMEDEAGEEDLRQQTLQGMKPGVSRTVEDLKEVEWLELAREGGDGDMELGWAQFILASRAIRSL